MLWPVRVQGETCAAEVAAAIRGFNALPAGGRIPRPDVLIVARGGGSLEDLWGFNEEIVVRAAAESAIPLISAVGHETDWTLIDLAADARAPTPTKAAEWAVPKHSELVEQTAKLALRLATAARRAHEAMRAHLRAAARGLPRIGDLLALPRQRFDAVDRRLGRALLANTRAHGMHLARCASRLQPRLLENRLGRIRDRLEALGRRADASLARRIAPRRARLERVAGRLGPQPIIERIARGGERLANLARRARTVDARADRRPSPPSRRLCQAAFLARLSWRSAAGLRAGARQRGPHAALEGRDRPRPASRYRACRRPHRRAGPWIRRTGNTKATPGAPSDAVEDGYLRRGTGFLVLMTSTAGRPHWRTQSANCMIAGLCLRRRVRPGRVARAAQEGSRTRMNRFEKLLGLKGEARLRYLDGEFQVLTPGDFVRCAVTGEPIMLPDLRYWSVELQEAYAGAEISFERHRTVKSRARRYPRLAWRHQRRQGAMFTRRTCDCIGRESCSGRLRRRTD